MTIFYPFIAQSSQPWRWSWTKNVTLTDTQTSNKPTHDKRDLSSMRLQHVCATTQKGQRCGTLSEPSSTSIYYVNKQQRLWRDCTDEQAHLSLPCLPVWLVCFSHGPAQWKPIKWCYCTEGFQGRLIWGHKMLALNTWSFKDRFAKNQY